MTIPPHLVRHEGALKLEMTVGNSRRRFDLTDGAEGLLTDSLGYAPSDIVPWVTAKALVLVGGATLPEGNDSRETVWNLKGADGGTEATEVELMELARYLKRASVEGRTVETLREHIRTTGLSRHLHPDDLRDRSDRAHSLRDIARDL